MKNIELILAIAALLLAYEHSLVRPGYLRRLGNMKVPFRIGLLQGGEWRAPPGLESNPMFLGYVVFLQNARKQS